MKKILLRSGFVSFLFLFSSCVANLDRVRIDSYSLENVAFSGASKAKINLSIKVYNPTARKLTLEHAAFDVSGDGGVIARLHLMEAVEIPAESDGYHSLPVELNITNMLALLAGGMDLNNPPLDKLLLSGSLKVKAGMLSRTITVQNKTIGQLLKEL
ncbi:MAG: hypothetical protein LBU42_06190 [Prevotellaceae bacterium]|jgi:LEA14-like dessication related protein|nr:hypothetical protein [Prevotellaceae bacterium]